MNRFYKIVAKSERELAVPENGDWNTPMFRGIGYAILALAIAVREGVRVESNKEADD